MTVKIRGVRSVLAFFCALLVAAAPVVAKDETPAGLEQRLDRQMNGLLDKYKIPGAGLALAYQGKIVMRKGYGMADVEAGQPVTGETVFRIASISKSITAVTLLKLFESELPGALERKVFGPDGLLPDAAYPEFAKPLDPRVLQITLRDLLQHTAGWKAGVYEPQYDLVAVAREMGTPAPASARTAIAYMLEKRKLETAPGAEFEYSNFGYNILGRVIEYKSGKPYAQTVQDTVLRRAGAGSMFIAGDTLEQRAPNESRYYDEPRWPPMASQHGTGVMGPGSYTDFHFPTMDAHGGWAATPTDLVKVALSVTGTAEVPALLKPATLELMATVDPRFAKTNNGLGWVVNNSGGVKSISHSGALTTGTYGFLQQRSDGWTWAVLFNRLPAPDPEPDKAIQALVAFQNDVQIGLAGVITGGKPAGADALQTMPRP